jgi:regulator of protease activity HflC (stomatin/prohibitin superfamily)
MFGQLVGLLCLLVVFVLVAVVFFKTVKVIGPNEVGLVTKRIGKKLPADNPIALRGEAGYQADLLMPGLRFALWPLFSVEKFQWVQVPAGQIGVVIAQVGRPPPIGAKSAEYKATFGNFTDVRSFVENNGEKGVQRPVLPPGTLAPIHPVAFLIITKEQVYGKPISADLIDKQDQEGKLSCTELGLQPSQLDLVRIEPTPAKKDEPPIDTVGIVTTFEGNPLPSGLIASRLGNFDDVAQMESGGSPNADIVETLLGNKNDLHNNYQDFQAFLDKGGRIGLQYDVLLYGAYALNPFLVRVELVPMLIVRQGEVAVVKAYVGLSTVDTSGAEFKFGSLVRPGHRGIWEEPLRTGKYPINPRCYQAEIVPTAILTLNWAEAYSQAHNLDRQLSQIQAKSKEGFEFKIDLQVQIHVPDTKAPRVISTVGTMLNLVNEVLQSAVGNHFRDKLQSMSAIDFIEKRQQVQQTAQQYITEQLQRYDVETRGVYIQDVIFPPRLVEVLTQREIANQEIETYRKQKEAQETRVDMEKAKGTADMQAELARSAVGIDIQKNNAAARIEQANGEATFISKTGEAQGAQVKAIALARAEGYREQVSALGQAATSIVNVATALAESKNRFVPEVLVAGGGGAEGSIAGLAASLIQTLQASNHPSGEPAESSFD